MPVYIFKCLNCGRSVEKVRPMSQCEDPQKCECGEDMFRDLNAEHRGFIDHPDNWRNFESVAAGVHPSQIEEARAVDRQHGLNVRYTDDGNPIFTGPKQRRDYCRAHGLYDRNAGYSDPAPVNR